MKPELQQKLYQKYPRIFRQRNLSMSQTCMCWGLDVGDGWYDIIDGICSELGKLMYETGVVIEATQVKEKLGGLRFYSEINSRLLKLTKEEMDDVHKKMYSIIAKGEELSYKTCETCGSEGKLINTGWRRTLCEDCELEYKKSMTLL